MAQVVVQDFELQGIPQPLPRPAAHPIDKLPPQLTKGGFNLWAHLTEDEAGSWGSIAGNEQPVCRFRQVWRAGVASVAQITKSYSSLDSWDQSQSSGTVIPIAALVQNITNRFFECYKLLILQYPIFGNSPKSDFLHHTQQRLDKRAYNAVQ
jgi:hypothetical protein